jgi:pimeloyl-ACP methyl ester carboxylesterase
MHCSVRGRGLPAVVIEADVGQTLADLLPLQLEIARHTTCVIYSRCGIGFSTPAPKRNDDGTSNVPGDVGHYRGAARITSELAMLLKALKLPSRSFEDSLSDKESDSGVILVGLGYGGLLARHHWKSGGIKTLGLVLLDPVVEGVRSKHSQLHPSVAQAIGGAWSEQWTMQALAFTGILRILNPPPAVVAKESRSSDVPQDERTQLAEYSRAVGVSVRHRRGVRQELDGVPASEKDVANLYRSLGDCPLALQPADVPITVLTHGEVGALQIFADLGGVPQPVVDRMEILVKRSHEHVSRESVGVDGKPRLLTLPGVQNAKEMLGTDKSRSVVVRAILDTLEEAQHTH